MTTSAVTRLAVLALRADRATSIAELREHALSDLDRRLKYMAATADRLGLSGYRRSSRPVIVQSHGAKGRSGHSHRSHSGLRQE